MSKVDRNTIDQIKDHIDIVQYIGVFVKLRSGGKEYKGLCPFHVEKTPSFTVVPEKGFYHCFGCGKNGDIIDFVQEYDAVSFSEAVEVLAEYTGVDLAKTDEEEVGYVALKLNREAMDMYKRNGGQEVVSFMKKRRLSEDLINIFNIGLASDNLVSKNVGENVEILLNIGLINNKKDGGYIDRFEKRLIFPIIHNKYPIGFGGRRTQDWQEGKYINSKASMIYDKSSSLFGLAQSKKAMRDMGFAYLVEGYTDVLALWTMGIKNVVAGCGTAFTYKQSLRLAGMCHSVKIMFDGDTEGRKAAFKATITSLKNGIIPYITELPKGKDPNNLLIEMGPEKAKEFINDHSKICYEYYGGVVTGYPPHKRISLINKLQKAVGNIIDDVTRFVLQQDISNYFNISYNNIGKNGKKSRAMSIDQQMLACLLNGHIGDSVFRMVKVEDFLEETDIFKYILDNYKPNEPQDIKRLLEQYKNRSWYITRAIAPSVQVTKNKAKTLAKKLRLRTISSLITKVSDQIEKKINEGKDFSNLQNKWDDLRAEQLILGNTINEPQW